MTVAIQGPAAARHRNRQHTAASGLIPWTQPWAVSPLVARQPRDVRHPNDVCGLSPGKPQESNALIGSVASCRDDDGSLPMAPIAGEAQSLGNLAPAPE